VSSRRIAAAAALGALAGAVATLVAVRACEVGSSRGTRAPGLAGSPEALRGAKLGPDDAEIAEIRVSVETGTVNGAGSQNPVLIWLDNRPFRLSDAPERDFAPGKVVTATLMGGGVPRSLGELRRASILMTLHLDRAEIAASWYCSRVAIELRLEGSEDTVPYLEVRDVGWLSQDEPPRRSPAFGLQ
jgi:hypothetical protein